MFLVARTPFPECFFEAVCWIFVATHVLIYRAFALIPNLAAELLQGADDPTRIRKVLAPKDEAIDAKAGLHPLPCVA